jgi:hypothetical protein
MIARGINGEVELAGNIVIVRAAKGFLQSAQERRIPVGRISSIEFKPPRLSNGYIYFATAGSFPDPRTETAFGRGGVVFNASQQSDFTRLRDMVEHRIGGIESEVDSATSGNPPEEQDHGISGQEPEIEQGESVQGRPALKWTSVGCAGLVAIGVVSVIAGDGATGGDTSQSTPYSRDSQQASVQTDADRQKGFHCLSEWDGANRSAVRQVRELMRNPKSFEHIETKIYGNDGGEHGLWMTFRAENGFGGMNVERIYARVDHETCEARLLPDGPGSG